MLMMGGVPGGFSGLVLSYNFTGVTSEGNWPAGFYHGGYTDIADTSGSGYLRATYQDLEYGDDAVAELWFSLDAYPGHNGGTFTVRKAEGTSTPGAFGSLVGGSFSTGATAFVIHAHGTAAQFATVAIDDLTITFN